MYLKITAIGNLGKDPEMRYTGEGKAVTNFSLAVNRRYNTSAGEQREETTWLRATAWGPLAETIAQYKKKGDQVFIEGRLSPDDSGNPKTFEGASGVFASYDVTVDKVVFLGSRSG